MTALKVGQTLWFVPSATWRGVSREVTVTKVGRKWASLNDNARVSVATMWIDGGEYSSPGRCWPSAEVYENWCKCTDAWTELRRRISWGDPPQDMTVERVREAAAILGVALDKMP